MGSGASSSRLASTPLPWADRLPRGESERLPSTEALILATTKLKRREYMILDIASRASAAAAGVWGMVVVTPRTYSSSE